MTFRDAACLAAISLAAMATSAAAQTVQGQDPAPAPAATVPTPICTDRPTKAYVACTTPAGDIQIESDLINWTRLDVAGTRTDTILYTNPTIKYGLGASTDIELNIAPYETVRTRANGVSEQLGGIGDLYVRLKQTITDPTSKTQIALIPYVKAPTARDGIGNGKVEGGIVAPILFSLPKGVTLNVGPELDVLADASGRGHHAQIVSLINLSKSFGKATLSGEFWNAQNLDPSGTVRQYSADVGLGYLLTPTLQLDVGGNFGLNAATPATQVYVGISTRF